MAKSTAVPAPARNAATVLAIFLACSAPPGRQAPSAAYVAEMEAWRAERDRGLRRGDGWLTLAGLYWLRPGGNPAGSASGNSLVFPPAAPPTVGVFHLENGIVRFESAPGVDIFQGESLVRTISLDPLAADSPVLKTGSFSFHAIERAGQIGIRLRDSKSPTLEAFTGMEYFPIEPAWRIKARFEPYDQPFRIKVPNIIGVDFDEPVYGRLAFEVDGKTYRVDPLYKPEDGFFVVFGDQTNGKETYGGGRFVATDPPAGDGTVILDFNKAYNPPCVFTPYATCPLPPPQNRLPFRIDAGELTYRADAGH